MKKRYLYFFSTFLVGCGNSSLPIADHLVVTGRIDNAMVQDVAKHVDRVKYIVITSQGGDTSAALDLARIIYDNKINIRVEKYSLSACAQLIIPAANSVEFSGKPILGLHHSAVSIYDFAKLQKVKINKKRSFKLSNKEINLFKHMNKKIEILIQPIHYLNVLCFFEINGYPAIGSKWAFFIPSPDTYERWAGKEYAGEFAYQEADVIESIKKYIPKSVSMTLITENDATWKPLDEVPKCPASQTATFQKHIVTPRPSVAPR